MASSGVYGAKPFDPIEENARALLHSIQRELADADFFSREDLLHISAFSHVATITRYRYISEAVRHLLDSGKLLERSRTELCLPGKARAYRGPDDLAAEFRATIERIARRQLGSGEAISVQSILNAWKTDGHLTENAKRVVVRTVCRALVREGILENDAPGTFRAA